MAMDRIGWWTAVLAAVFATNLASSSGSTVSAAPTAVRRGGAGVVAANPLPAPMGQAADDDIVATFHACPPGIFASEASPEACPETERFGEFQVFVLGGSGHLRTLADADIGGSQVIWSDVPPGDYLLNALALPSGFARFFVPGLEGINAPPERGYTAGPNEGYVVPIGSGAPPHELDVYLIPTPQPGAPTTDVDVVAFDCPPGVQAAPEMEGLGCEASAPPAGLDLALEGDALLDPGGSGAATPTADGGWSWPALPEGDYVLRAELPPGVDGYAVRASGPVSAEPLAGGDGYLVAVNPGPGDEPAALAVYLLEDG
jgi:hypothetical protein